MHRTVYILDVISSVSRSSKCNKIVGGWGFAPDPIWELTALSRPPSWVSGGLLPRPLLLRKVRGLEGKREEKGEMGVPK